MHFSPMPQFNEADIRRFWRHVEILTLDECWCWKLTKSTGGYGQITVHSRTLKAHRVAYYLFNSVDPESMLVCHKCDNPPCCNPYHLFLGTEKDNIQDAKAKGRLNTAAGDFHGTKTHPERHARGVDSGLAKLNDVTARLARDLYSHGLSQQEIAARLGVTRECASRIIRGNNWKHVILPDEIACLSDPSRRGLPGASNPGAKLTPELVREIRAAWDKGGVTFQSLGERYGITKKSVFNIVRRVTWKDLD